MEAFLFKVFDVIFTKEIKTTSKLQVKIFFTGFSTLVRRNFNRNQLTLEIAIDVVQMLKELLERRS